MSKIFLDSNICVYGFDESDVAKQDKVLEILRHQPTLSSQVIIETYLACSRKLRLPSKVCDDNSIFLCDLCNVAAIDANVVSKSVYLKQCYQFSFLDSVIIATALLANCTILYTEDMQHGQEIEGQLKILNPFLSDTY